MSLGLSLRSFFRDLLLKGIIPPPCQKHLFQNGFFLKVMEASTQITTIRPWSLQSFSFNSFRPRQHQSQHPASWSFASKTVEKGLRSKHLTESNYQTTVRMGFSSANSRISLYGAHPIRLLQFTFLIEHGKFIAYFRLLYSFIFFACFLMKFPFFCIFLASCIVIRRCCPPKIFFSPPCYCLSCSFCFRWSM